MLSADNRKRVTLIWPKSGARPESVGDIVKLADGRWGYVEVIDARRIVVVVDPAAEPQRQGRPALAGARRNEASS